MEVVVVLVVEVYVWGVNNLLTVYPERGSHRLPVNPLLIGVILATYGLIFNVGRRERGGCAKVGGCLFRIL